jgi:hypothetical protein
MTVTTISIKADEPVTEAASLPWICIFCVSGSDSTLQNAIDDFKRATGR